LLASDIFAINQYHNLTRSTSTTRGHPYKLYKQHSSCTARSSFFTEHVVNIWNSLLVYTNFSKSLSGFIRQINRMDFLEFRCIISNFQCCVCTVYIGLAFTGSY